MFAKPPRRWFLPITSEPKGTSLEWVRQRLDHEWLKKILSAIMRQVQRVIVAVTGHPNVTVATLGGQPETHILGETFYSQAPLRFGDFIAKIAIAPISSELTALIHAPLRAPWRDGPRQAPPPFGLPDAAHGHGARYGRGHPAISNPSMATKEFSFGDQHLSQHAPGAFTCKFAQRIVDGLEADGKEEQCYLSTWRIAPFGRSGRLDTRLDTPPSINRRHLNSRLARPTRLSMHGDWGINRSSLVEEPQSKRSRKPSPLLLTRAKHWGEY